MYRTIIRLSVRIARIPLHPMYDNAQLHTHTEGITLTPGHIASVPFELYNTSAEGTYTYTVYIDNYV